MKLNEFHDEEYNGDILMDENGTPIRHISEDNDLVPEEELPF